MAHRLCSTLSALAVLVALTAVASGEDRDDDGAAGFFTAPTPWQIRQKVDTLLADLSSGHEDEQQLLSRARRLLDEHHSLLIYSDGDYRSISDAIHRRLRSSSLEDRFVATYASEAQRQFEAIVTAPPVDQQALLHLARSLPGTPAARQAWQTLADIAWDRGQLGSFLRYSQRSQDDDPLRQARVAAAYELLETQPPAQLPQSLDQTYPLWTLPDLPPPNNLLISRPRHHRGARHQFQFSALANMGYRFAAAGGNAIAANDGNHLLLINPHNGRQITRQRLSASPRTIPHPPVHHHGVYIAISPPTMIAINEQGEVLWRHDIGYDGHNQIVTRPVVAGNTVAIAVFDGEAVSIIGRHVSSGEVQWRTMVGSMPRRPMFGAGRSSFSADIAVHQDRFVILTNNRIIAHIERNGHISAIHPYDGDSPQDHALRFHQQQDARIGHMRTDGTHLVIAPTDRRDLIIYDHSGQPVIYAGQGAGDDVVDVADGQALLVGRRITCLDLATQTPVWSIAGSQQSEFRHGVIGDNLVLVHLDDAISLLRRDDGALVSRRASARHERIAIIDGMLITSRIVLSDEHPVGQTIIGHGLPRSREELERSLAADPHDFAAHLALASLYRARHQDSNALNHLTLALENGAPAFHADDALRLALDAIRVAIGHEQDFASAQARLNRILRAIDATDSPLPLWWQGRHLEMTGQLDAARKVYQTLSKKPRQMLEGDAGLGVDSMVLAELALNRLGDQTATVLRPPPSPIAQFADGPGWSIDSPFLAPPIASSGRIIGYEAGLITARDLNSGKVLWQAIEGLKHRAMLGLQDRSGHPGGDDSLPTVVDVIPGSAAAAAGFRDGDHLRSFNNHPVNTFADLVQAISAITIGQPFTAVVQRTGPDGAREVHLSGRLGSWLSAPIAVHDDVVLIQGMTLDPQRRPRPDMINHPMITALDVQTGTPRWELDLNTRRLEQAPLIQRANTRVMSIGTHLLVHDGLSLSAYVHDTESGIRKAWTRLVEGDDLRWLTNLALGHIGVIDDETQRLDIIDLEDGRSIITVPADLNGSVLIDGQRCFTTLGDGRLMRWDLDLATRRWTSEATRLEILAVRGDSLWTRQRNGDLLLLDSQTGRVRQRFDDFIAVHQVIIAHDQVVVHGIDRSLRSILTGMGLRGGARRWTASLPDPLEIRGAVIPTHEGFAVILDALDERPGLWQIDRNGTTLGGRHLGQDEAILSTHPALITQSPTGLHRIGRPPQHRPRTIACPPVDYDQASPVDSLRRAAATASWIKSGASSISFFHHDQDLLIMVDMPAEASAVHLHIDSSVSDDDARSQRITFHYRRAPTISSQAQGWQRQMSRMIPREDGRRLFVLGLRRSALSQDRQRPRLHIPRNEPDAPPWWLREAWHRLDWRPPPPALPREAQP